MTSSHFSTSSLAQLAPCLVIRRPPSPLSDKWPHLYLYTTPSRHEDHPCILQDTLLAQEYLALENTLPMPAVKGSCWIQRGWGRLQRWKWFDLTVFSQSKESYGAIDALPQTLLATSSCFRLLDASDAKSIPLPLCWN